MVNCGNGRLQNLCKGRRFKVKVLKGIPYQLYYVRSGGRRSNVLYGTYCIRIEG